MNVLTKSRRRVALVGATGLCLILAGGAVALASEGQPTDAAKSEPYAEVSLAPSKTAVSAEALWSTTLDTLACMEQQGVTTQGPYPSADGHGVQYSYVLTEGAADVEIECGQARESLAMRFAMDDDKAEAEKLVALRADLERCVTGRGVELDTGEAAAAGPDGALQKAAAASPDVVRGCAEDLDR